MSKIIANNKTLDINVDINFVINNPIFVDENSFSFPGSIERNETTEDFFGHIGNISKSDSTFSKIYCIFQHQMFSINGVLHVSEAGDMYNFHFVASDFWDKAKSNKLAVLLENESKTFTHRKELKDTWAGNYDMVFAPLYNYKFTDGWPIGMLMNELINDPSSFDDDSFNSLFVPFFKLDSILQKAAEACGARIVINELKTLADYSKTLLYNNYALNNFETGTDTSGKKTIPIVYFKVRHPWAALSEIMLPETAPPIATKFYLSQLEDPENAIEGKTFEKSIDHKATPDKIFRFEHSNSVYDYPCVNGFIEVNTRADGLIFSYTNPLTVSKTNHGLVTGEYVYFETETMPLIHHQLLQITRIDNNTFTVDVDGTAFGDNQRIPIHEIYENLEFGYAFVNCTDPSWPDHLKIPHGLQEGEWIYVVSPILGINKMTQAFIDDDYNFKIGISEEELDLDLTASKGFFQKINTIWYGGGTYFAQKRKTHIITEIRNTNPCQVIFRDPHMITDKSVLRFHNTGISALDNNSFTIESPEEKSLKLKDVDGTSFTPYQATMIGVTNYHKDAVLEINHINAPVIAYAELLEMKNNIDLTIEYKNHMPDITLDELIKAVENKFLCKVIHNIFTNEIHIRLLNNAVKSKTAKKITSVSSDNIIVIEPVDGYYVTNPAPSGDTYYPTIAPVIDYDKIVFKANVLNYADLPLSGNSINDVRLVTNTQKLYMWQNGLSGAEEWKYIGLNIIDVFSGNKEFKPESNISTFMHYGSHCRTDQQGSCKTVAPFITTKPTLSMFFFNYPGGANPHTSNGFENSNNNLVLFASGSKGLYAQLMSKYIYWYTNIRKGSQRIIQWNKDEIVNLDFSEKISINHHEYFVKSINLMLKANGTIQWGISELYKA